MILTGGRGLLRAPLAGHPSLPQLAPPTIITPSCSLPVPGKPVRAAS